MPSTCYFLILLAEGKRANTFGLLLKYMLWLIICVQSYTKKKKSYHQISMHLICSVHQLHNTAEFFLPFPSTDSKCQTLEILLDYEVRHSLMLVRYLESRSWTWICNMEGMEASRIQYSYSLCSALLTSLWRWLTRTTLFEVSE